VDDLIVTFLVGLIGAVAILLRRNRDLESDNRLNEIKVEDAKLETKQDFIVQQKKELERTLDDISKIQSEDLSDEEIVEYWSKKDL
jgi:hypothetical protein